MSVQSVQIVCRLCPASALPRMSATQWVVHVVYMYGRTAWWQRVIPSADYRSISDAKSPRVKLMHSLVRRGKPTPPTSPTPTHNHAHCDNGKVTAEANASACECAVHCVRACACARVRACVARCGWVPVRHCNLQPWVSVQEYLLVLKVAH